MQCDGNADAGVLFEDDDVVTALGELARRHQSGGAGADDDDVTQHVCLSICGRALPMCPAR